MEPTFSASVNKDLDDSISAQSSHSQLMPIKTQNQTINKNIENLKKLQNKRDEFNELYNIFDCIVKENDFDAINFAVKEKFHEVKHIIGQSIYDRSIVKGNSQLARLII